MGDRQKSKWYFETNNITFSGANDPIHETFRPQPYYSIVRESIQNSLDVRLDKSKPIEVRFEVFDIKQKDYPELFSIREHIEGCLEFHKANRQARDLYGAMLSYLDENPVIKVLKVSDYNTVGMNYEANDPDSPFISFMGEGISSKSSGSGGSFGFGKGAYYVPSVIRTILVSTMVAGGASYFQGRTRLASHKFKGETKGKDGVFNITGADPITEPTKISPVFRRHEQGTDVYIIGMQPDPDCGKEMVKSVLNNFWLAVHENRLDVVIKTDDVDIRFDETNLEEIMNEYFPDETEQGSPGDILMWNPRAYYKSVKYAGQADNFHLFNDSLPSLGPVRFYVYRKDGLKNRICFMRKPAMTVYKTGRSVISGFAAVFVCDNDDGNEILRQMENAAHNEWKPENVRYVPWGKIGLYRSAKREINDFITKKLSELLGKDNTAKIEIAGLSDYLTIPEELLDADESIPGKSESNQIGTSSRDETKNETGLITSNITTVIKPKVQKAVSSANLASSISDEGDLSPGFGGDPNNSDGGNNPGSLLGNQSGKGKSDPSGKARTPIPLSFRIAAVREGTEMVHNIILMSDKEYENAGLLLFSGTDNGDLVNLNITNTDAGIAEGNSITNINLRTGRNIIKVQFDDNIRHSLKITAYEV